MSGKKSVRIFSEKSIKKYYLIVLENVSRFRFSDEKNYQVCRSENSSNIKFSEWTWFVAFSRLIRPPVRSQWNKQDSATWTATTLIPGTKRSKFAETFRRQSFSLEPETWNGDPDDGYLSQAETPVEASNLNRQQVRSALQPRLGPCHRHMLEPADWLGSAWTSDRFIPPAEKAKRKSAPGPEGRHGGRHNNLAPRDALLVIKLTLQVSRSLLTKTYTYPDRPYSFHCTWQLLKGFWWLRWQ